MNNFKTGLFGWVAVAALGLGGCAASTDDASMAQDNPANRAKDATSAAAAAFDFNSCNWDDALPPGSYLHSCEDCTFEKGVLACSCFESNGKEDAATLTLTSCPDRDIANCEGVIGIGTCYEVEHKGTCWYTDANGKECVEWDASATAEGQKECAAHGGSWLNEPCSELDPIL